MLDLVYPENTLGYTLADVDQIDEFLEKAVSKISEITEI